MKQLAIVSIILIICLTIISVPNTAGAVLVNKSIPSYGLIISPNSYANEFHTGAPARDFLISSTPYYSDWDAARPFIKYATITGIGNLSDDGNISITNKGYNDITWNGICNYLSIIYGNNDYPILEFWIANIESVSDSGLRTFLKTLSGIVGNNSLIFDICPEGNFPSYMPAWGDRGNNQSYYIAPDVYNAKMSLIRTILDQENIKNILLGYHANMLIDTQYQNGEWHYNPNFDGVIEFLDAMRQADVVGFSFYVDNLTLGWERAKAIYNMIGTSKPCLFFEYAPTSPWQTGLNVTAQFVNASYSMLVSYTFVKGIIWYFGPYSTNDTMIAIKQNAQTYG